MQLCIGSTSQASVNLFCSEFSRKTEKKDVNSSMSITQNKGIKYNSIDYWFDDHDVAQIQWNTKRRCHHHHHQPCCAPLWIGRGENLWCFFFKGHCMNTRFRRPLRNFHHDNKCSQFVVSVCKVCRPILLGTEGKGK